MKTLLGPYEPQLYAVLRMVVGFLFLWHGTQKLFGIPGEPPAGAPAFVIWIAGPLELIGGVLIVLGLFTRVTAFVLSGLMAAAYWIAHGQRALLPIVNGGELAALYCFVFLFIAARGAGPWSLDGGEG